jgi:hypothetical protein
MIQLKAKTTSEYIELLADILGFVSKKREMFIGIITTFWDKGYFECSMANMAHKYPWAGSYGTIVTTFQHMIRIGIMERNEGVRPIYRISPAILVSSGRARIQIEIEIGESEEPELVVPITSEEEIEPVAGEYVNPRYKNLIKKDLEIEDF